LARHFVRCADEQPDTDKYSYFGIMAPVGPLVAAAVKNSLPGALINIFAGIPADVKQELDMDTYIANRCFMFGTSGSTLSDMKLVLRKVIAGKLNTDVSVDAVSGMVGATDGLKAVENRTLSGKILIRNRFLDAWPDILYAARMKSGPGELAGG
jgi:L-sorbose 1-phosphate reductase